MINNTIAQSNVNKPLRYFSGKRVPLPLMTLVGDPGPIFNMEGKLSGYAGGHLPLFSLYPKSLPLVTWQIRVGLYQGNPISNSISESKVNSSPSSLKAISNGFRNPALNNSHFVPAESVFAIQPPGG